MNEILHSVDDHVVNSSYEKILKNYSVNDVLFQ